MAFYIPRFPAGRCGIFALPSNETESFIGWQMPFVGGDEYVNPAHKHPKGALCAAGGAKGCFVPTVSDLSESVLNSIIEVDFFKHL